MITDVLIDIDTLYDTRLEIAKSLDKKSTDEFVKSGEYCNRVYDDIGSIPFDIFEKYYKRRHFVHLVNATSTNLLDSYLYLLMNIDETTKPTTIYINFYPYYLTPEQLDYMITKVSDKLIYTGLKIEPVWLNNIEIFDFLKKIKFYFNYDYETFLILHHQFEMKAMLKNIILISPEPPVDRNDIVDAISLYLNWEPHPYKLFSPKDLPNGEIF